MYSILVADDEKDVVSLLKDYLELKGYCVYTAYNGAQAIEQASKTPDLILLDVKCLRRTALRCAGGYAIM